MSTLELQKQKQTNARVYAERAERLLFEIADKVYEENITPGEIYNALDSEEYSEEETLNNLFFYLQECKVFNTKTGLDLQAAIQNGDTLFIRCTNAKATDVARKIAQIVFTATFEHIKKRESSNATPCIVVIDEFKFLMNTSIMDNLATIRDQKGTLVFNFQDISNFTTSPNEALRNPAYAKELLSNSHIIAIHNANDIELIRLIQQRAGKKTYHKAFEDDTSNTGGTGETAASRRWTTHTEFVLTENEISTGGKKTAILLSPLLENKMARLHTDIIKTEQYPFTINTEAEMITIKTAPKKEKTTQYNAKKYVKKSQNNPTNEDVNNKIDEKNSAEINNNNSVDDTKNEEKLEGFVVVEDENVQS